MIIYNKFSLNNIIQIKKYITIYRGNNMKILKTTMYIIELIAIILYLIMNHLANTNLSIMKGVIYINNIISSHDLVESISFFLLIVFFILVLINMILISKKRYKFVQDIYISVLTLVGASAAMKYFNMRNLFTYYYFLLAMLVILSCEIAKVIINIRYKKSISAKI